MRCPHCDETFDDSVEVCPHCNKRVSAPRRARAGNLDPGAALSALESRPPTASERTPPRAAPSIQTVFPPADYSPLTNRLSGILALLLIIAAAQGWQIMRGMSVKAQSWHYVIEGPLDDQLQDRLKELGSEGWELVSARRATTQVEGETKGIYEMIFRRPSDAKAPAAVVTPSP